MFKNYTKIKVPAKYAKMLASLSKVSDRYSATVAPGYYYTKEKNHSIYAETGRTLLDELEYIKEEQFQVLDDHGEVQFKLLYEPARSFLANIRPDYTIRSEQTGELLEDIDYHAPRARIEYTRIEEEGGAVSYCSANYAVRLIEEDIGGNHPMLVPLKGQRMVVRREWVDMPRFGLKAFMHRLERQLREEQVMPPETAPALLSIQGDREHPLIRVLLDLAGEQPDLLQGLIDVRAIAGEDLAVTADPNRRPPYLRACRDISRLLQDYGYGEAARFLGASLCWPGTGDTS